MHRMKLVPDLGISEGWSFTGC